MAYTSKGYVHIKRTESGQFHAQFKAPNHKILCATEPMHNKHDLYTNIEAMLKLTGGSYAFIIDATGEQPAFFALTMKGETALEDVVLNRQDAKVIDISTSDFQLEKDARYGTHLAPDADGNYPDEFPPDLPTVS